MNSILYAIGYKHFLGSVFVFFGVSLVFLRLLLDFIGLFYGLFSGLSECKFIAKLPLKYFPSSRNIVGKSTNSLAELVHIIGRYGAFYVRAFRSEWRFIILHLEIIMTC